jgi:starvation-inducible DNA-binding protein
MSNKALIQQLSVALADTYTLYLKTQNFHWNVEGPHFHSLHEMFEEQYTNLASAVDEIAERIRALGSKAPGSYKAFQEHTSIADGDINSNASEMVNSLFEDNKTILKSLNLALKAAQDIGDEASADLMIGRITFHEKTAWMLRSSK